MKRILATLLLLALGTLTVLSQNLPALEQLKADPRKGYGNDYPYAFQMEPLTPAPRGYKPFYISHYARHGSRYYHTDKLYFDLDTLLTAAHEKHLLTEVGESFYRKFMDAKVELLTGATELTDLGWEQHQGIARTMYERFPEVFWNGGNVLAIASLSGRCVISMSAFCQELVQCNPKIEVREQSSRFFLNGVVPTAGENPDRHYYPRATPKFVRNNRAAMMQRDTTLNHKIMERVFISTEGLPGSLRRIPGNLLSLYTSLPSIGHEGMMDGIVTDEEIAERWESSNQGSYVWVFGPQYDMIPILRDIIGKADAVLDGTSDRVADLRFGHDTCLGPLTVLMGINGADRDPEDASEIKDCYQNWETCKAANIQLVFYRGRKATDEVLVKCLMNGFEATLPMGTDTFPYYKWSEVRRFYLDRCDSVKEITREEARRRPF